MKSELETRTLFSFFFFFFLSLASSSLSRVPEVRCLGQSLVVVVVWM